MSEPRRVCVEFRPELCTDASVVRLLARAGVAPMLAFPDGEDDEARLFALQQFAARGLPATAWPLLADAEGYWPGLANVAAFVARTRRLVAIARKKGLALPWVAVDLEPPLDAVARLKAAEPSSWPRAMSRLVAGDAAFASALYHDAAAQYAALHKELAAAGARTLAIAYPTAAGDLALPAGLGATAMQRLAHAPLDAGWDGAALLVYVSLLAGWSRGVLSVDDARWLSFRVLEALVRRVGARAGAFVGIVGKGKLGDEPAYDDPAPLAADVAMARAAGVTDVSLFCLEGVVDSPAPEAWLATLHAAPHKPARTGAGELVWRGLVAGAGALAALDGVRALARRAAGAR